MGSTYQYGSAWQAFKAGATNTIYSEPAPKFTENWLEKNGTKSRRFHRSQITREMKEQFQAEKTAAWRELYKKKVL